MVPQSPRWRPRYGARGSHPAGPGRSSGRGRAPPPPPPRRPPARPPHARAGPAPAYQWAHAARIRIRPARALRAKHAQAWRGAGACQAQARGHLAPGTLWPGDPPPKPIPGVPFPEVPISRAGLRRQGQRAGTPPRGLPRDLPAALAVAPCVRATKAPQPQLPPRRSERADPAPDAGAGASAEDAPRTDPELGPGCPGSSSPRTRRVFN